MKLFCQNKAICYKKSVTCLYYLFGLTTVHLYNLKIYAFYLIKTIVIGIVQKRFQNHIFPMMHIACNLFAD